MKCIQCGKQFATELGSCPFCATLPKKPGSQLGKDFISRLFSGDIPYGTPFGDRYEIEELVGRGGMGIVYRSKDRVLHETVAIKILNPLFGSDEEIIVRFKQEIKLARKINHKNVIHIYDIGEVDGIRYISMEYVHGKDLKEVIRAEGGGLPLNVAIPIIQQLAEALQVAHDLGIIHRDIKPQNILIQRNGDVKVLDFGIARLVDSEDLSRTGSLLGSPVYMSPEQASGKNTDHRTDIYSFGVIMFEIFTGRIPFLADTPIATALKHVNESPPLPRSINKDIPDWIEKVILRAMEKDPKLRFQRVLDIIDPVHGLHVDRITDTDIIVCSQCGKHNPISNSSCSNCHSFLGRDPKIQSSPLIETMKTEELKEEVRKYMKLATHAFEHNNFEQAKEALEQLLTLDKDNIKAQGMLEVVESKILLEKKINLYHQNALIAYQDKKYDEAVTLWEKILILDPGRSDFEESLNKARQAQNLYDRIKGFINKGLQSYNENNYQQAIDYWEQVIEIDPRNAEAAFYISKTQVLLNYENRCTNLQNQADIFIKHKEFRKAIECYEEYLKLDPEDIGIQLKLDELKEQQKISHILNKGLQYYKNHDYERAISSWKDTFAIDANNIDAHNYIIQARAKINEVEKVKELFRIGLVHYRDKHWQQAISKFEDVKKFDSPYQQDAIKYITKAELQETNAKEITKLMDEALLIYQQEHKDSEDKMLALTTAIKKWETVIEYDPHHKHALEYIAKAQLIIRRSQIIQKPQKKGEEVPEITSIEAAEHFLKTKLSPKKRVKRKKIKIYKEISEYIHGAIMGAAIGDALGVGNSWVAYNDKNTEEIRSYKQNHIGRFQKMSPGEYSGELALSLDTSLFLNGGEDLNPTEILKAIIKSTKKISAPLEQSTEKLIKKLKSGQQWKESVSTDDADFAPFYRTVMTAIMTFNDETKMINNVKTLVLLTHKNKKVLACCIAAAYAIATILEYRNTFLKSQQPLIGGGDTVPIPLWDNATFVKSISNKVEVYDQEVSDQILELLIHSSMPSDRFFDMVGISERADETLLAALFCFLKNPENFYESILIAINARGAVKHITGNRHGIACLTGFFSGAFNGFIQIPAEWINGLLEHESVFKFATDLYQSNF